MTEISSLTWSHFKEPLTDSLKKDCDQRKKNHLRKNYAVNAQQLRYIFPLRRLPRTAHAKIFLNIVLALRTGLFICIWITESKSMDESSSDVIGQSICGLISKVSLLTLCKSSQKHKKELHWCGYKSFGYTLSWTTTYDIFFSFRSLEPCWLYVCIALLQTCYVIWIKNVNFLAPVNR